MSARLPLAAARDAADSIVTALAPWCERIEIAGSVRRERPKCKDIEIVAIPWTVSAPDLFGNEGRLRHPGFVNAVNGWERVKGDARDGRYMQRRVDVDGLMVTLDLFLATADNWGAVLAVRTGSADYSHRVLAAGWVRAGFRSEDGYLRDSKGHIVPVPEEHDLFALIGVPWCEPREREMPGGAR